MSTYVVCPDRNGKKVAVEICLNGCELRELCEEFLEVPAEVINSAGAKELGIIIEGQVEGQVVSEAQGGEDAEVQAELMEEEDSKNANVKNPVVDQPLTIPSNGKAQRLYQQALSLRIEIGTKWFELGEVLEEMFVMRYYIEIGFNTWHTFLSEFLEPLDRKWRSGDYLRTTVSKCKEVGISKEVAGQIGWTKLKETVPVLTKENKSKWIKEAQKKGMTTQKLNAKVRVAQGKITEKEAEILPEKMIFSLFKEQKEIVELALDIGLKLSGSESKGHVLADMICPEFLSAYPPGQETLTKREVIAAILRRFESGFNVRFLGSVIEAETGEVLLSQEKMR